MFWLRQKKVIIYDGLKVDKYERPEKISRENKASYERAYNMWDLSCFSEGMILYPILIESSSIDIFFSLKFPLTILL